MLHYPDSSSGIRVYSRDSGITSSRKLSTLSTLYEDVWQKGAMLPKVTLILWCSLNPTFAQYGKLRTQLRITLIVYPSCRMPYRLI